MRAVLAHWGCTGRAERVRAGSINSVWRVEAGDEALYLRAYRTRNAEAVRREHAAIGLARAVGLPTPAPVPLPDGSTVLERDGQLWALFEAAPGIQIDGADLNADHARAMGAFLADLHDRLPLEGPSGLRALTPPTVERTIERLLTIRDAILALPKPDERDGWALERTRQRLNHLKANPASDQPSSFPDRFLHGDFQDGNLFFAGGRVCAIIDWENVRKGPRAWEVVRCLHLSLHLERERCQAFLAGDRDRLPLPDDELEDGARFYSVLQERNVWLYESVYLDGHPAPRVFIRPPPDEPFGLSWARFEMNR